jgi:hypothetical protein
MNLKFLRRLPKGKLQKLVFVGIVTLGAVVGVVQCYLLKNWSELNDTRNRIAKFNDQIRQANHTARKAAQDETEREQVKSFLDAQHSAMITGDPFAWVVREITLLSEGYPVHVMGIQPGGKEQQGSKETYDVFTMHMEIEAGYDELGVFLRDIENKFPTIQIRLLDLSVGETEGPKRHASLRLAFLIQPETVPGPISDKPKQEKKTS